MHVEFLQVDGGKMGKSLGNTYTLDQLQEKGIEPLAYKLFCFSSHYTKKLNFTWEGAKAAQVSLDRLRAGVVAYLEGTEKIEESILQDYRKQFLEAINDDLNATKAMSIVWEIVRSDRKSKDFRDLICEFDQVLGLDLANVTKETLKKEEKLELPEEVEKLVEQRTKARQEKNWAESDRLRDEIIALGYSVRDGKEGMTVEKSE